MLSCKQQQHKGLLAKTANANTLWLKLPMTEAAVANYLHLTTATQSLIRISSLLQLRLASTNNRSHAPHGGGALSNRNQLIVFFVHTMLASFSGSLSSFQQTTSKL